MAKPPKIVTSHDLGDIKHDLVGRVLCVLQGRIELVIEALADNTDPKVVRSVRALEGVLPHLRTSVDQLDAAILALGRTQRTPEWRALAEGCERLDPTGRYARDTERYTKPQTQGSDHEPTR